MGLIGKNYHLTLALLAEALDIAEITWREERLGHCYFPRACASDLSYLVRVTLDNGKGERSLYQFHTPCYMAFLKEYRPDLVALASDSRENPARPS